MAGLLLRVLRVPDKLDERLGDSVASLPLRDAKQEVDVRPRQFVQENPHGLTGAAQMRALRILAG